MDLNGLCCNESSPIKCVFAPAGESQELFQSQINLKVPLPDHRVEARTAARREGKKGSLKESKEKTREKAKR